MSENQTSTIFLECVPQKDINDVFDDLLFVEERLIETGYKEGFNESSSLENTEAYHLGYHRGAEFGAEIGYYKGIVEYFLHSDGVVQDKKVLEKLEALNQSLENFPKTNVENVDIFGVFSKIRAQFKKICALLKSNHLLWDETDNLSF